MAALEVSGKMLEPVTLNDLRPDSPPGHIAIWWRRRCDYS